MDKSLKERHATVGTGNGFETTTVSGEILSDGTLLTSDSIISVGEDLLYTPPRRNYRRLVLFALLGVALIAALLIWLLRPTRSVQTATVRRATIVSSVETTGKIESARSAKLAFKQSGRVERVLIEEGDFVEVGQVLAELDNAALQRQLEEAKVQLEVSRLKLQQAKDGPLPSEIARATADVDAAQARLDALKRGPSAEDLAAAQAAVNVAQAKYDALKKGASTQELSGAQARLDGARANRSLVASTAMNTKEQARLALQAAEQALADGKGTQTQVDQAKSNYDAAKSAETSQIAAADAQVREAQAVLDSLKAGASAEELKGAEEAVAQAQANLDKVKLGATPEELTEAESRVTAAQAALDRVKAGPTETDLAILEQGVALSQLVVDGV